MFRRVFLLSSCLLITAAASAQSLPSAEGGGFTLSVGGAISRFNPDYGCSSASPFECNSGQLWGPTIYTNMPHLFFQRIGVSGEMRFLHWKGPSAGLNEDNYLAGPQVRVWRFGSIADLNIKFLLGDGHISIPGNALGQGNHFVYAPGIDANFHATRRLSVLVDYEYQFWPGFESVPTDFTSGTGGLTPNGFTVGVSYRVIGR